MKIIRKRKIMSAHRITQQERESADNWPEWLVDAFVDGVVAQHPSGGLIVRLGYKYNVVVPIGDWIVRDRKGNLTIVTADDFAENYSTVGGE